MSSPNPPGLSAITPAWIQTELLPLIQTSSPNTQGTDINKAVIKATLLAKALYSGREEQGDFLTQYRNALAGNLQFSQGLMHDLGKQDMEFQVYLMVLLKVSCVPLVSEVGVKMCLLTNCACVGQAGQEGGKAATSRYYVGFSLDCVMSRILPLTKPRVKIFQGLRILEPEGALLSVCLVG